MKRKYGESREEMQERVARDRALGIKSSRRPGWNSGNGEQNVNFEAVLKQLEERRQKMSEILK